jgi:hypothetical protein
MRTRTYLAALMGAALILAPMPALPAEVYTACVIGKVKARLRSLGYGRNATAETNLQITDSATKAALRHCKPLYPKHLKGLEEEALGDRIEWKLGRLLRGVIPQSEGAPR